MESYKVVGVVGVLCVMVVVATPPSVVNTAGHLTTPDSELEIATWMEVLYGIRLDEKERGCADQQKVLHRASDECFQLYHRGPCGRREWLVFDRQQAAAGRLVAQCKRRECAPKWGFDSRTNKCFEHSKCPPPTAFHYTLFGDGKCLCNATAAAFGETPRCQELFKSDVCPPGKILAPRYTLLGGLDSVCTPDPCLEGEEESDLVLPDDPQPRSSSQAQTMYTPRQSGMRPNPTGFADDVIHFGRRIRGKDVVDEGIRVFSRPNAAPGSVPASGSRQHFTSLPLASILQTQRRQAEARAREEGYLRDVASRLQREASAQLQRGNPSRRGVSATRVLNVLVPNSNPDPSSLTHGAANALFVSLPPSTLNADRLNVLLPHATRTSGAAAEEETSTTPRDGTTDVRLNVKYQDGTSMCHTRSELNITCELQMKPLFSDLSDVKVPLCVEKLFRFAIGRVGKSEECVMKDDGVCATKVNVISSQPFDWDFE